jgi:hypothetical protein
MRRRRKENDMGFLDKLLGREPLQQQRPTPAPTGQPYAVPPPRGGASTEDERAIARYKYLLRTAPPEDIEKVHTEAFGKLTPEQRQMVLQRLNEDLPEGERPRSDEPADLARSATRAEMSRPGYLQGAFGGGRPGGMGTGMGMGGMIAGSMLGTIAGVVVGSALADMMLGGYESSPEAQEAGDASADAGDSGDSGDGGDSGDSGGDAGGDAGGSDAGDAGGGDFGGDFGGGDFGGDFGGGDFGGF